MSNDRSSEVVQRDESIFRLQLQLQQALHKCAEFELQVLNSRDHALGQAAEIGALRFRIVKQAATYEQRLNDQSTHITNHLAHISRLESAHAEANQRANVLEAQRQELIALRSSTTWKIGRFFMLPVRVLKRLTRRS
ncbi:MAG: hypothetical protein ACO29D_03230 [Ilumatobacteraceae bacterium]